MISKGYTMSGNGAMNGPASAHGAPTVHNSALAQATDDQLYMARAGAGSGSPIQQRIDALTGVSQPSASTMGAPTASDSAFYADGLTGKVNKFTNQVHAKTGQFKQAVTNNVNNAKNNISNGYNQVKNNVIDGFGNAKNKVVNGVNTAKDGIIKGTKAAGTKINDGYHFGQNLVNEAGLTSKNAGYLGVRGAGASVTADIRDDILDGEN
jgi:hypothetical protein